MFDRSRLQIKTELLGDHLAASQGCDILQHRFTTVAKARSLHGYRIEGTTQLVHDQHRLCFAFDIFGDHQQWSGLLYDLLKQWQNFLRAADLLICNQDVRIVENRFHLVRICDHVWGYIATIELHPFYNFKLSVEAARFFNRDDTVFAHFFHRFRDLFADFFICCRDRSYLRDRLLAFDRLGDLLQFFNGYLHRFVDPSAQSNWASACSYVLQTFANQGLRQNRCCRRSVTSYIIGLRRHFLHELCAHVLEGIFQFDFLSDGNAVIRNQRAAEFLLQYYVATFWSQCNFYRICQSIYTTKHSATCIFTKLNNLCHE